MLEEESRNFNRSNLVDNLDTPSTKHKVIYDVTRMVKCSTLSLEILSGKNGFGSLWFFFKMSGHLISPSAIHKLSTSGLRIR